MVFNQVTVIKYLLILIRISAVFSTAPIFSSVNIPGKLRVILVLAITLCVFPTASTYFSINISDPILIFLQILFEIIIGLIIGLLYKFYFHIFQMSGQIFSFQMGLGIANVYDPMSSIQIPLIGQFFNLFAILLFFMLNAHHLLIRTLIESFELIPTLKLSMSRPISIQLAKVFSKTFLIAFKLAVPILGVLFVSSISLGLLAKTAPQMNIFLLGLPFKILISLFLIFLFIPVLVKVAENVFLHIAYQDMMNILRF